MNIYIEKAKKVRDEYDQDLNKEEEKLNQQRKKKEKEQREILEGTGTTLSHVEK